MSRTVLITGGGTGIGAAIAARFTRAGDRVHITGRRPDVLKQTAAALEVTPITCDHTDPVALTALLEQLPAQVDVLVNNAGGNTDFDADGPNDLAY